MSEALLALGIACTAAHLLCDLAQLSVHMRHPRDYFVLVSTVALVGHVVLTGEATQWLRFIGGVI